MENMKLSYFTKDESFPFYINYGAHTENMFFHGHEDFFELVVVLSGRAIHRVGEERFEIKKGDVFSLGNGTGHAYEEPEDFRICNIMFRPEALISADFDIKQLPGFHALFLVEPRFTAIKDFRCRLKLNRLTFDRVKELISATIKEYDTETAGRKTMLTANFLRLAVILSRAYDEDESYREITGIAEAAAYMENNFSEDISVERLVAISHYSQRHFIRLFTEAYGTPPQKYLAAIRMRHACSMLKGTDMNVTEISAQCGFNDPNYFSRIFRKNMGITPLQYRKSS